MNQKDLISLAPWPQARQECIDLLAEEQERLITDIVEDTLNVIKATKITPQKIYYYTAASWKWKVYLIMLERSSRGKLKINELMRELSEQDDLKSHLKEAAKFVTNAVKEIGKIPEGRRENLLKVADLHERETVDNAEDFLKERFGAQITVYSEEDVGRYDPRSRATLGAPCRPAIYIE
jgi:leucyl-tRNA synthetase